MYVEQKRTNFFSPEAAIPEKFKNLKEKSSMEGHVNTIAMHISKYMVSVPTVDRETLK